MMKGFWLPICTFFILLFSTHSYSENPLVENDEERFSMLLDKCEKIRATNPDSAVIVAQQALSIAIKINQDLSIVRAEHLLGY